MIQSNLFSQIPHLKHGFGSRYDAPLEGEVIMSQQVHEDRIFLVDAAKSQRVQGYDAFLTQEEGISLCIKTADCLPVLMIDPMTRTIAAVHSGWRGSAKNIVVKTLHEMISLGADPEAILVASGPHMRGTCYEVDAVVWNAFPAESRESYFMPSEKEGHYFFDNALYNHHQLIGQGIRPENIDVLDRCTFCEPEEFFSYRREKDQAGRLLNWIRLG